MECLVRKFGSAAIPMAIAAVLAGGLASGGVASGGVTGDSLAHAASGAPLPGGASPGLSSAAGASALPTGRAWRVTLVTGDVVGVRTVRGRPPIVTITPGPGRQKVIFSKYADSRGHIRVVPQDVAPLVGKVLDPTLFDVTTLIRDGDDDARRADLPLIVQGEDGASGAAAAAAVSPALRQERTLSTLDAVAVTEPRSAAARAGGLLAQLASAAARAGRVTPAITRNVRYIWLDRTLRATGGDVSGGSSAARQLDRYLTQIGAPAAWRAGDTGRGVTVAVLDTGVDAAHPDLKGQIVAQKNFSGSPGTADRFGHGTFVAGEVAGTGAASGGERRGVAFGARLAIGKVLNDDGTGQDSTVIAGMQWAASRAKVISMSLGDNTPSDGTDPVSEALNRLSTAHHVLFVVAAGNSGPADETVGAPAAASDALAVGAVDATGQLASFSSRGPRVVNYAIKPEIVAPGVNITGDRGAGTTMGSPLSARYTTASGTSMATPLVAGAAAVLAAVHPGWGPVRLKAALVSTAQHASGGDVYELGGGLLDVATAVTANFAGDQAVANLGDVPFGATHPVTRTLSWTNTTRKPVTLNLSADLANHAGRAAPRGAIGLSSKVVRVPARGSASVTLSVSPVLLDRAPGLYEGHVVARAGHQAVRTPVGILAAPPTYALTVHAIPLPGTAAGKMSAYAGIVNVGDADLSETFVTPGSAGTATVQVPAGHYWVIGEVDDLTSATAERSALVGQPEVTVEGNTTVSLDGTAAVPVTASVTGHPTQQIDESVHVERSFDGQVAGFDVLAFGGSSSAPLLYAQPSGAASTGTFHAYTSFRLVSPAASPHPYVYDLWQPAGTRIPASLTDTVTPAQQGTLARVDERFYALNGDHSPILDIRYGLDPAGFLALQNDGQAPGGSTRTDYVSTGAGISWNQEVAPPLTVAGQSDEGLWVIEVPRFARLAPGSRHTASWVRQPFAPEPYSGTTPSVSQCAPQPTFRRRGDIHVELTDLQDLPDGFDCLGGVDPLPEWSASTSRTMRLYQGSHLIGTSHSTAVDFSVPATSASYRLSYADNTAKVLPVSTRTVTTWTFRSAPPAGLDGVRIPLLLVNYSLPLNLDNHPDGNTAVLTVARIAGTPAARVTGLRLWTSTDEGKTWHAAPVRALRSGRYAVTLPRVAAGQSVSLRVTAADAGGSSINQTIITAYHG
jgi:subtilisin family serine protease